MSGQESVDDLAMLIASFIDEVKPFFAGIRSGVAGIFAVPRDRQAITAARQHLSTLAASSTILDLPAARQLAELAHLTDEAFQAAERGGIADESQGPLLRIVDDLEGQLDGLLTGDDRGRERLDNAYRLLEQVLQTAGSAEAVVPALSISLDDLLSTLQPEPAPEPSPESIAAVEAPAPAPVEPTATELVLVAEEEVAPIEWGEKEAILWKKRGWDESGTSYGNTEWLFIDEEETVQAAEQVDEAQPGNHVIDQPEQDNVIDQSAVVDDDEVTSELPPLSAVAAAPVEDDVVAPSQAVSTPVSTQSAAMLDHEELDEAVLLALSVAEQETYLALDAEAQQEFLQARRGEMTDFATAHGLTVVAPVEQAGTAEPPAVEAEPIEEAITSDAQPDLEAHAEADSVVAEDRPEPEPATDAPALAARVEQVEPAVDAASTAEMEPLLADDMPASEAPQTAFFRDDTTPPAETRGSDFRNTAELEAAVVDALVAADQPDDAADDESVPVDELLLVERGHSTDELGAVWWETGELTVPATEDEETHPGLLGTDRLIWQDEASADSDDNDDQVEAAEEETSFLDDLLDEPGLAIARDQVGEATSALFAAEFDDEFDPNYGALPEISPELESAFSQLSEADMATFLTLDNEAAIAFMQSRLGVDALGLAGVEPTSTAAVTPSPVAAEEPAVVTDEPASDGDLDPEILDVFRQEVQELLVEWEVTTTKLRRAPGDRALLTDLRRVAHTLKGAANMMGFSALGACGGRVEEIFDALEEHEQVATPAVLACVDRSFSLIQHLHDGADPAIFADELAGLEEQHQQLLAAARAGELVAPANVEGDDRLISAAGESTALSDMPAGDDEELIEVFVQEAEEHLAAFNTALVALDRHPAAKEHLQEAQRIVHTLKGASAALGYGVTAALCHTIEDLFETLEGSGRKPSREMITLFFESAEVLESLVSGITAGRGEDATQAEALRARYLTVLGQSGPATPDLVVQSPRIEDAVPALAAKSQSGEATRSVRVEIAHLDTLLNLVGELVINRTGQEQLLARVGRAVSELLLSVDRLRRVGYQLESRYEVAELLRAERRPQPESGAGRSHLTLVAGQQQSSDEFDALEMDRYTELHSISRELIEIASDINTAGTELETLADGFDQTLSRQGRIATELQDRMMEVRLVPLSTISARLYRAVRGVAQRRRRQVEFVMENETVEIDKLLLEEITGPLLHLVRNAADHGIELPQERVARGKQPTGTIRISAAREGNEAVIRINDDGAGIDLDRVAEKALARGIIRNRDGLTREQLFGLIFLPGFSTSASINDISGRGVGLDVVRTNVTRLKGTIDVDSSVGSGTTFTIRLPIMLAVTRALMVRAGAQTFAIPLPVVEQVASFSRDLVKRIGGTELFDLGGTAYPVIYLSRALGMTDSSDAVGPHARALIAGSAERRVALVVDELIGQQEIVVKQLGRHLQSVAGVAGATILGNGQVVLILNVLDLLVSRRQVRVTGPDIVSPPSLRLPAAEGVRMAMVVDDSLSMRRVLTRTLERDGWQVLGAKDGVEAFEMLSWAKPQVMVVDIEMPRMDGYELTSLVRNHPEHRDLPIAILTSRSGEKHRRKAFDLGVSAYLVKPFDEAELLRTVRELGGVGQRQRIG